MPAHQVEEFFGQSLVLESIIHRHVGVAEATAMKKGVVENTAQRLHRKMTKSEAAKLLNSSQSRVAKMEVDDGSVSLDLLVRSILALGVSIKGLIQSISTRKSSRAA